MPEPTAARLTADQAVTTLFERHYAGLVRLAALVLRSNEAADEVVQDAFVALYGRWDSLQDEQKALAYLRRSVVNGCQSRHRHLAVVDRHMPRTVPDEPSAESEAIRHDVGDRVLTAVAGLPVQQRTVVVLRYYGQLSEAEIAEVMGISRGSVKSHASRAASSLRDRLKEVL